MGLISDLSVETIASGITGVLIAGAIVRQAFKGWIDAKAQSVNVGANAAAMVSAVAMGFDNEQRKALIIFAERIAMALEAISRSQASLVDDQKTGMDEKLDFLVSKLDDAQADRENNRRQTRAKPRARRPANRG